MKHPTQEQLLNAAIMLDGAHPAVAAMLVRLAEQQAAEPNAVLVEGFSQVALRKLNDLREKGYAVNGVSIASISEAGETNRGAVTTGGMVLWWPQQPAQQPLTDDQINILINGHGEEGDHDYVEPTGDGLGLTDADLVRLVRRAEAAHGITSKEGGAA